MASKIQLTGITWDHSRGFTSIVGVSQRFHELNPDVEINWSKRSLQAFADAPIDDLAAEFDLLIIDHPWAGFAAKSEAILPLDQFLDPEVLSNLEAHGVGKSHESYQFNGHQWAIAIDAATPVAASRPDLFEREQLQVPQTWDEVLALARNGRVAIPGIPQDTLMSFYMICSTLGEDICQHREVVISEHIGIKALEILGELGAHIPDRCFNMNPIRVYESMTSHDEFLYSPFAYGYANYARKGYARYRLKFHDLVTLEGNHLITTLGGTGLAISSQCDHRAIATAFTQFAADPNHQEHLFFDSGGQPGHRLAWVQEYTNSLTDNYFLDTLPALDRAFLRPRYAGHMFFQDRAGAPIRDFMMKGGKASNVLDTLNQLYQQSLQIE